MLPRNRFDTVFTISEISSLLKEVVENTFSVVKIQGELSSLKRHTSGHLYFSLKDQNSILDAVCWKMTVAGLQHQPIEGAEVICTGRLTTYAGRSKYQMIVESMELAGEGALLKKLEALKQQLKEEGLFDTSRKKLLPKLPQVIGIVTSPTGAVIQDILHRLQDRFPVKILLWPVHVQGTTAAQEVSQAIEGFNKLPVNGPITRPDLLIVARGGGSLEDLWPFNEEIVVRATAYSIIPIISAVGHETDTMLIDYASDCRAPTPTAAAEIAVPVRAELLKLVADQGQRLVHSLRRRFEDQMLRTDDRYDRFQRVFSLYFQNKFFHLSQIVLRPPKDFIKIQQEKFQTIFKQYTLIVGHAIKLKIQAFTHQIQLLEGYSYTRVLERGFCLAKTPQGTLISKAHLLHPYDHVILNFSDGSRSAQILKGKIQKPPKTSRLQTPPQPSLFFDD